MVQLGAREALENDMGSLKELHGAGSVVKVGVEVKVAGTWECLQSSQ